LVALAVAVAGTQAATINFAGVINDDAGSEITQWKTAATTKTLDPDGDNVYGTAGSIFYTVGTYGTAATFGGLAPGNRQVGPYGYVSVDHPDGVSADIQVRTTTNDAGGQANHDMAYFDITASAPLHVRVGITADGLDGAQFSPASIGLRQIIGGTDSAEHTLTAVNNTVDMVFFDVLNVSAGDRFAVFADSGTGNFATHSFVSLDEVPEPATMGLLAMGGLGVLLRRRRK